MFWHGILIHFTRYQILSLYLTPISLYYFIFELFLSFFTLFQKYQKVLSLVFKHAARKHWEISLLSPQLDYTFHLWIMAMTKKETDTMGEL